MSKITKMDYVMWVSFACIMIHLYGYTPRVVFWEVYYKFIHDLIIIFFSLGYASHKNTHTIGAVTGIGFASYFCAPLMIRLYLAIEYFKDYKAYRSAINSGHYNIPLLITIFVILLVIYAVKTYYATRREGSTQEAW